jgi:hypothetical protein
MLRKRLLLALVCAGTVAHAQVNKPIDTIPKKDSLLIEELKQNQLDNIPVVSLDENDLGDAATQNISSVLTAGRDPFYSAASFNFSALRFSIRGYSNDFFGTYMNGIPMDNLDNGFTPYGLWGGLNDVMRNRDVSYGLSPNSFAFGDIGSNTNIDSRASRQRVQTSLSYANSNRNYGHRWMISHSTGISKKGWAFSFAGSRRYADEGYVPGTWYNGWSYFAAADKRINDKHLLSLAIFGAPTENGRQGASVPEMIDLANDHFYNPNWGYQNGQKRNASVGRTHQPVAILTHDFHINNNTSLTTAMGYSFGDRSVTALDWYNAPDPRPDYYRYLPSYAGTYASVTDPAQEQELEELMRSDINYRQINWQRLYDVNRASYGSVNNANGIPGNTVSGMRAHYIVENRIINTKRFNANSVLNTRINGNIDITAGASFQLQENHYYKKVEDLLGGDFYVNLNQFAERDFPTDSLANQNDVDHPNRILYEGDKFGYDYNINIHNAAAWAQGVFKYNKVDFFLSGQFSRTDFQRVGNVRNGLFLNDSYGPSVKNVFNNYAVKGGLTYKINGRNYIYARGGYMRSAPYFENVFISARTRNTQQDNITSEEIQTAEAGYVLNSPTLKLRVGGYYTHFANGMDVMSFYHDAYQNFVNYALSGIDRLHFGGEFGVEARVTTSVTINAAASVGRYYYDSKQHAVITADNSASVLGQQLVYAENFRVPSTPQEAYSLGATYRSPKFWFISVTANYFNESYLSFNPLRRTYEALKYELADKNSAEYHEIFDQTKFDPQLTMDFFGGWSYKLPRKFEVNHKATFLVFNLGLNNLLNNKDMITGGYEQLRYDAQQSASDPVLTDKFPPKFFYAYGFNYFASVTLRF